MVTMVVVAMVMMVNHHNHLRLRRNRNCYEAKRQGQSEQQLIHSSFSRPAQFLSELL
jgi:hypothetical protein